MINELIQEIKNGRLDKKQVFKTIREGLKPEKRELKKAGIHVKIREKEKVILQEKARVKGVNLSVFIREKLFA